MWALESHYHVVKKLRRCVKLIPERDGQTDRQTELLLLIFCISQGSVATHLKCGGKYNNPYCKFTAESNSERIFKIGQHFSKL